MTPTQVLILSLSIAFTSQQITYIPHKPFNCLMCLTGWTSGLVALCAMYGAYSALFIPCGVLLGAIADNLMKKYL